MAAIAWREMPPEVAADLVVFLYLLQSGLYGLEVVEFEALNRSRQVAMTLKYGRVKVKWTISWEALGNEAMSNGLAKSIARDMEHRNVYVSKRNARSIRS